MLVLLLLQLRVQFAQLPLQLVYLLLQLLFSRAGVEHGQFEFLILDLQFCLLVDVLANLFIFLPREVRQLVQRLAVLVTLREHLHPQPLFLLLSTQLLQHHTTQHTVVVGPVTLLSHPHARNSGTRLRHPTDLAGPAQVQPALARTHRTTSFFHFIMLTGRNNPQ